MSSLMDKMLKAGSVKHATILQDSKFFTDSDLIPTDLPILNIAFSADLKGGLTPGITFFAGESKSFKTLLALFCLKAYLEKYPDAIAIFYDSEYGTTPDYLISNGIDPKRILHVPVEHIEQLKFDIKKRLNAIERGEKIFILIDSVGNLASVKEVEDADNEKSVADMSRAKALKSLFRIITPMIVSRNIPCVAINHTYKTMELYAKDVMGGGTGPMYSANTVFIITKSQEKDGTEITGYKFTINVMKSRTVREKSKFPFTVYYKSGISRYSGLLDIALEGEFIIKPSMGWYQKVDPETGEVLEGKYREKDTHTDEFWSIYMNSERFNKFIHDRYRIGKISGSDAIDEVFEDEE